LGAGPNPSTVGGSPEPRSHIDSGEYQCRNWRCLVSCYTKVAIASVSKGWLSRLMVESGSEPLLVMKSKEIIPQRDRGMGDAMAGIEWMSECSIRFADHRYR
jgi:hypothetical protein